MNELEARYEPDNLWTDSKWDNPYQKWKSTDFLVLLYNESSVKDKVCVNDRWGIPEKLRLKNQAVLLLLNARYPLLKRIQAYMYGFLSLKYKCLKKFM
jgi:hypothetical protein